MYTHIICTCIGLNGGEIAGIVIALLLMLAILAVVAVILFILFWKPHTKTFSPDRRGSVRLTESQKVWKSIPLFLLSSIIRHFSVMFLQSWFHTERRRWRRRRRRKGRGVPCDNGLLPLLFSQNSPQAIRSILGRLKF